MQKSAPYFFILIVYLSCTFIACTNDELPEPEPAVCNNDVITYDDHIKVILDLTCAYDGCHVSGFSSGDFTDYASLEPFLASSGALADRSVTQQDMPPSNVPDGRPEMLTADQIEMLRCWIDQGYLEN